MRSKLIMRVVAICMAIMIASAPVNTYASTLLKYGSKGTEVTKVQSALQALGFYRYSSTTGYYGSYTQTAVKNFQKAHKITPDGVIGDKTLGLLFPVTTTTTVTTTAKLAAATTISTASGATGTAIKLSSVTTTPSADNSGALDWFTKVREIWKRGMNAVVTDIDTGKSFEVKRTYGTNHADVEPLTQKDSDTIKEIWGGFNWQRRAVVVQVGDYTLAGSMTGMPHAGVENRPEGVYVNNRSAGYGYGYNFDAVKGNGVSGHLDIHFKNSKTHGTGVVQPLHQQMVAKAAAYIAGLFTNQNV